MNKETKIEELKVKNHDIVMVDYDNIMYTGVVQYLPDSPVCKVYMLDNTFKFAKKYPYSVIYVKERTLTFGDITCIAYGDCTYQISNVFLLNRKEKHLVNFVKEYE